ncbi:Cytochrome b5 [Intoshia linei]|uniref:Cytochrome b5 n=1 Tax=Intoshia linei TaxID=1819745 RepID=A0A177ASX2_9BILA|nr:Cytochrome b5 [Intoshia linei]
MTSISDIKKSNILNRLGVIESRLIQGANESIQLQDLSAHFSIHLQICILIEFSYSQMSKDLRCIRFSEVQEHQSNNSIWVVMDNKVYDLTEFQSVHPGGADIIQAQNGLDATDEFNFVGHSQDAIDLRKDYQIGCLHEDDIKAKPIEKRKITPKLYLIKYKRQIFSVVIVSIALSLWYKFK